MASVTAEETKVSSKYDQLMSELDLIRNLEHASACLEYDKMVFMPSTAASARAKQSAALAAVIHEKSIDPKIGSLLSEAVTEAKQEGDKDMIRNIKIAEKEYTLKTCIPKELAAKKAQLSSEAYTKWDKAREANDFSMFSGILSQCIDCAVECAQLQRKSEDVSIYATMLDEYEVGMDPARIDSIFAQIKESLVPLIDKVLGPDAKAPSRDPLNGNFAIDAQKEVCQEIVKQMGFNEEGGRIDVSVHPFTMSISPADVRITSRFREDEWYQGLAASIHEGGHAIYEQNIGGDGKPVDGALSMGMHESQSLFWERHVGLSSSFWKFASPIVNDKFGTTWSPEDFYGAVNAAEKSFIRVEADELTYPLHIILRYEIERDFVDGKTTTDDIPIRWNNDFEAMMGLEVPSDAKGCLQDIHWSMAAYGYFPTYLLGAATAAQLAHYCELDIPDMQDKISQGKFAEIKEWLTEKVHKHGKRHQSLDEHLKAELGEELNPKYFIKYLEEKYSELYNV